MTQSRRETAKFFCGFEAFHGLFHAYLWVTGTSFTAFGITAGPTWNALAALLNGAIALALGLYGWRAGSRRKNP